MIKKYCCSRSTLYLLLLFFICSHSITTINATNNSQQNEQETVLDETDKLALETFSNTVNCMFNIVHQPNNKQNIISNVSAIIGGIFKFVAQVVGHDKKNKQTDDVYRSIDKQLNELLEKLIAHALHLREETP